MTAAARPLLRCWETELVEHVAHHAAERGDTELESLCNDVLAGRTDEELVLCLAAEDPEIALVVERGRNLGWRARS